VDRPITRGGDGEDSPDGCRLDHRAKSFVEIDVGAL
jgi:hypothetical protein